MNLCPEIDVMVGGDDWALEGLCAGAVGWISGVVDVLPRSRVRLWELCQAGDLPAARELYAELLPLARLDMTPKLVQYFKAGLDELGIGGGPCRPPRLPLTDDELAVLRRAVAPFTPARWRGRCRGRGRAPAGRVLATRRALRAADHLGPRDHPLHRTQRHCGREGLGRGMINLRGQTLPVVDLFEPPRPELETSRSTRILVVEVSGGSLGLIVDGSTEILHVPVDRIAPLPTAADTGLGDEIAAVGERLILLIDPERALGALPEAGTAAKPAANRAAVSRGDQRPRRRGGQDSP